VFRGVVLLTLFGKKAKQAGLVGLEIGAEGVAIAHRSSAAASEANFSSCEFLPFDEASTNPESDRQLQISMLGERINDLGLRHAACNVVLPLGTYQLLLVDAPKVEPSELAEAIRWRIKDLISFPLDEAAVDAFLLPADSSSGGSSMAYAVVVRKDYLRSLIEFVEQAKLTLNAIDISELSLQNLLASGLNEEEQNRSSALVKLRQGIGSLHVYKSGNLYLSRQFKLAYNAGLLDDLPEEALTLELQRSLDYYERQMRQIPPKTIYFCGDNITEDKISAGIRSNLTANLQVLPAAEKLTFSQPVEEHILSMCLSAVGVALRVEGAA